MYTLIHRKSSGQRERFSPLTLIFLIFIFFQSEHSRQKFTWLQLICKCHHSLLFCYPFLKSQLNVLTVSLLETHRKVFPQPEVFTHFLLVDLASGVKTSITEAEF